jgi:integrase
LPTTTKSRGRWNPPAVIMDVFHQTMVDLKKNSPPVGPANSVATLLDLYLDWCEEHRAAETFEWYRWRLQEFKNNIGCELRVCDIQPFHLDDWLAAHPEWSSGTKHGMARAVMRTFRWAYRAGRISANPIADYEKPRPGKRTVVISPAQFEEILAAVPSQQFRDLLEVTWETACRPQESLAVEARHVDLAHSRWIFPPDEAKGEQWPRIVYLTERALEITRRLAAEYPAGPLFRNSDGVPWTTDAVNCGWIRVQVNLGRKRVKTLGLEPAKLPRHRGEARKDKEKKDKQEREVLERRKADWKRTSDS